MDKHLIEMLKQLRLWRLLTNWDEILSTGLLPIIQLEDNDVRYTMAERQTHYRVPGVSVAVIEGGEVSWAGGFGRRERDKPDAVSSYSVFLGASISKPVTALLVLQHVERGVLNLDEDINRYLKRWQVKENEFTRHYRVTLRGCLSHTAGLTVNGWGVKPQGRPVPSLSFLPILRQPETATSWITSGRGSSRREP